MTPTTTRRAGAQAAALLLLGALVAGQAPAPAPADAQEPPAAMPVQPSVGPRRSGPVVLPGTEELRLSSQVNGVEYRLWIAFPPGYAESEARFPTVYMLDADYSFALAKNVCEHLTERNDLPPLLLVAIGYGGAPNYRGNRTRDYTPTFVPTGGYGPEHQRFSGGAGKFLQALEQEIIPAVEASYRTLPNDRTLVGHSYGGLFGSFALLSRPRLFHRFLLVSPSIWYDDLFLLRHEAAHFATAKDLPARVYFAVGARENPRMATDLETFAASLKARGYTGLAIERQVWEAETHNSIFPAAFTRGIRWLFEAR